MIGYGTSGTTHDFFAFDTSGNVWSGAAFVPFISANFATYRITATEVGTSGRFTGTTPAGTATYELRERGATLDLSYVVWTDTAKVDANVVAVNGEPAEPADAPSENVNVDLEEIETSFS